MPTIVGYEDIVGSDYDPNDANTMVGANGEVLNAAFLPQSFIGAPLTTIAASSTGTSIPVPVLRNIRPDRWFFDRVQAASALVYDVKIGTVSLNASTSPAPGDMYAPDAVGSNMRCTETATPSVGITLIIGNRTATAITAFTAGCIGPSTKPS